jgi:hypothetical protein
MRYQLSLIVLSILLLTTQAAAQPATAVEKLEKLRLELIEVQGNEDALRARAQQLEEDVKPDNIARSLAGIGSTKPEELREFRRRQLELEKKSVLLQLDAVSAKRVQLEGAIAALEAQAYQESAQPKTSSISQSLIARLPQTTRPLLIVVAGGLFAAMGGAILLIRRLRTIK